jgi:hypothetical protein
MHQVGFGDCFLLSFRYDRDPGDGDRRRERHVLIDFGSTRWPAKGDPAPSTADEHLAVANAIADRSNRKLDAVVMTHRHKDHLSGFGQEAAGAVIAGLQPRLVVRPWTENPGAARDATRPDDIEERSHSLARGLHAAQGVAAEVENAFMAANGSHPKAHDEIVHVAADQVPNQKAVDLLNAMAAAGDIGGRYVYAGRPSGLEEVLPGVRVTVLGPPTVEQWPKVASQRANDEQYWLGRSSPGVLGRMLLEAGAPPAAVRGAANLERDPIDPGPARWLVERMRDQNFQSLLRLTRALDDAMNNTSVVLLFEVGDRRLLFPGDAQIENWSYALDCPEDEAEPLREHLREVDLYKVGHHGSRNATPRSLVDKWTGRDIKLTSIMSTLPGVHGESEETAVPRGTLIDALADLGPLRRTDTLKNAPYQDLVASTKGQKPFRVAG